jgi:hypothetical protein
MRPRPRAKTSAGAAAAGVAIVVTLLAASGSEPGPAAKPPPNPRTQPGAVQTGCAQQSGADFPGAYADRRNLVVGPLALIGGATFTDAATARRFGGNKFPLLVRAGHSVTVSVPASARRTVSLGYGPLQQGRTLGRRDGHHTVTFVACSPDRVAASHSDGPVTFWSGFVMVSAPSCAPLEVYVDDDRNPRRVKIELGRRCAKPPPLRGCADHVEGPGPSDLAALPDQVVIGPLRFASLAGQASRREFAMNRAGSVYRVKAGVGVPAGVRATLTIGRAARRWAALSYAPREPGEPPRESAAVRFQACAADHPAFSYDGPVGPVTGFSGGFVLKRPGCVPLEVRVAGRPTVRARVPFGVGRCT